MKKRTFLSGCVFLIILFIAFGVNLAEAEYPEKKIRVVVPYSPGGGADLVGRALVQYANPYLGGKIYVGNVPGAGGAIGFREGSKASADGYTITVLVTSITVGPHVVKDFPKPDIFDPICVVALDPRMFLVKWDSRFKTAQDLISYAKTQPEELKVSFGGYGTCEHLNLAAFAEASGGKFTLVPYKGAGPSLVAAMGGHVDLVAAGGTESRVYLEGKKLRPLIVFGEKRYKKYPDAPTAKELGYDVVIVAWRGLGAPKGTPQAIINQLGEAFQKAVADEGFKNFMDKMGLERIYLGPKEAGPWIKAQNEYFKGIATKIGIEPK